MFIISAILYAVHLADKEGFEKVSLQYNAGFLSTVFTFIDNYSPFHEVNNSHIRPKIAIFIQGIRNWWRAVREIEESAAAAVNTRTSKIRTIKTSSLQVDTYI